ncbi:hypothetical protein DY000_02040313 [Brassica cretica]|uniref:Uncharacterized protein n=1 Tax=Brassica cretica TaxID=69181 RepID=A0ABQ7BE00_BRACR|nr:hypothetical protein DY000_02040313 [Brassica cretica]
MFQLGFAFALVVLQIADLSSLLSSRKLMSEMYFKTPSSGVHQDLVNVLGWEDAGVERQNLSCSEFEPFCPISKVVSIDARLMMSIGAQLFMSVGAQLLMSVDTSTSCLWKASFSSFSCSSTSPKSSSKMALTWCLSLSTAFPLTRASCFFTASAV